MATSTYLERYQAGEHVAVWRELIAQGDRVQQEPLRSESIQVCTEIVLRARSNLRTLHARLLELGYEFAEPDAALVDAGPDTLAQIEQIEQELGALPLIARVWYGTLASVNFQQAESQLCCSGGVLYPPEAPDIFGLGSHSVLIFQSLPRCREQYQAMLAEEAQERDAHAMADDDAQDELESADAEPFLPLGAWASNCEPKGFSLPCAGVDAVLYNDGGGDFHFVDELRSTFQWGGFPFWQWAVKRGDFYAPCHYRPNFAKLLPVLKEGLVEL